MYPFDKNPYTLGTMKSCEGVRTFPAQEGNRVPILEKLCTQGATESREGVHTFPAQERNRIPILEKLCTQGATGFQKWVHISSMERQVYPFRG